MSYRRSPLSFGDAATVLGELSSRTDLLARVKKEPISTWVLDPDSRSYLFPISGILEFEGSGYLLCFRGEFFEIKTEAFGNRVAFYKKPEPTASTVAEVQKAFLAAIAVYDEDEQLPVVAFGPPVFVDSYKNLWRN